MNVMLISTYIRAHVFINNDFFHMMAYIRVKLNLDQTAMNSNNCWVQYRANIPVNIAQYAGYTNTVRASKLLIGSSVVYVPRAHRIIISMFIFKASNG